MPSFFRTIGEFAKTPKRAAENILTIAAVFMFWFSAAVGLSGVLEQSRHHIPPPPDDRKLSVEAWELWQHDYISLLVPAILMAASGVVLVALLIRRIANLEQLNSERQKMMSLLEPRIAAIEAAGDGIGITDRHGIIRYVNAALARSHGYRKDDLDGKPWSMLYSPAQRVWFDTEVFPVLHRENRWHWQGNCRGMRDDGSEFPQDIALTLMEDGGWVWVGNDVTDRLKAEKERDHLQKQFFQAQKMEAIGRLAGGIAHDFNNILASMMGYNEFLLTDLDVKSKEHHFARQIMHGALQARRLVEQILTFSRSKESARADMNIVDTVNEVTTMLRATISTTVALDTQIDVEEAYISGNATQISQILMNLCINARDAIEGSHGMIRIRVRRTDAEAEPARFPRAERLPESNYSPDTWFGDGEGEGAELFMGVLTVNTPYIAVSVEDTGCGIARDVMEHMFEPFFTTKDKDRGTGLGLSTVQGMVAAHQGAVAVRSTSGARTSFTVYLPALREKPQTAAAGGEDSHAPRGESGRILIVEDQEQVRTMIAEMLQRMGYKTALCSSGDCAIDHLRENPDAYDLVVSDYQMPHMTGAEMAAQIGADFPQLPVILVSGFHDRKTLDEIMKREPAVRAILRKPVDSRAMAQAIQSVISAKAGVMM